MSDFPDRESPFDLELSVLDRVYLERNNDGPMQLRIKGGVGMSAMIEGLRTSFDVHTRKKTRGIFDESTLENNIALIEALAATIRRRIAKGFGLVKSQGIIRDLEDIDSYIPDNVQGLLATHMGAVSVLPHNG